MVQLTFLAEPLLIVSEKAGVSGCDAPKHLFGSPLSPHLSNMWARSAGRSLAQAVGVCDTTVKQILGPV